MTRTHFQNQCKQLLVISITFLSISLLCQPAWSHNKNNTIKYAPNPPYDNIPITPKTWEEVDLIYYSTISGHRYTNTIELLRPIAWLHKLDMDIIGSKVTLSMPEFGIVNVLTTVKAIKPTQIDTRGVDWSKQNSAHVIGKFMRYVTDVRTYTFKDSLGHISHINATPNHPFYVKNNHGFVAIGNVSDKDTLVGAVGSTGKQVDGAVHLVCPKGQHSHCGVAFRGGGLPTYVYNVEVYRRHVYRVGGSAVLVHNVCEARLEHLDKFITQKGLKELNNLTDEIDTTGNPGYFGIESFNGDNYFSNYFSRDRWIIDHINKDPRMSFYANDVTRRQYRTASQKGGFFGHTPSKILLNDIHNKQTFNALFRDGQESIDIDDFKTTPLGKHVSKIARDFQLKMSAARWIVGETKDIEIDLMPIIFRPW